MPAGQLRLDHPSWKLSFGVDVSLGRFDQIIQSACRYARPHSAIFRSYGDSSTVLPAFRLDTLLTSLLAGICINYDLLTVQEIGCWGDVMHIVQP